MFLNCVEMFSCFHVSFICRLAASLDDHFYNTLIGMIFQSTYASVLVPCGKTRAKFMLGGASSKPVPSNLLIEHNRESLFISQ